MNALVYQNFISGPRQSRVHTPRTLREVNELQRAMPHAALIGGATWIMRAPLRGTPIPADVIALSGVAGLDEIKISDPITFGSMVTLESAARILKGLSDLAALREACVHAATPPLRRMITLGGSVAATDFHASDIVPALLCLEAEIISEDGVITEIRLPRSQWVSCHERLTWRSGGEYSVASISLSYDPTTGRVRVALGSIESTPRRWTSVEQAMMAESLTPHTAARVVHAHLAELEPVTSPGIPGSYRLEVLPTVMDRAVRRLL